MRICRILLLSFIILLAIFNHASLFGQPSTPHPNPVLLFEQAQRLSDSSILLKASFSSLTDPVVGWFNWYPSLSVKNNLTSVPADSVANDVTYFHLVVENLSPFLQYKFHADASNEQDSANGPATTGPWETFETSLPMLSSIQFDTLGSTSMSFHVLCPPTRYHMALQFFYSYYYDFYDPTYGLSSSTIHYLDTTSAEISLSENKTDLIPGTNYYVWANYWATDTAFESSSSLQTVTTSGDPTSEGVIIPITLSNASTYSEVISFGVHKYATACIDRALGEYELPPWPPSDAFYASTVGKCFSTGLNVDLVKYSSPSQVDTFQLRFQAGSGGYPVHLSWPNLHSFYAGPVTLKTFADSINMLDHTSYDITDPDIESFSIIANKPRPQPHTPNIIVRSSHFVDNPYWIWTQLLTNSLPVEAWYEWGTTPTFGNEGAHHQFAGTQMLETLWDSLPGQNTSSIFYYRVVAQDSFGTYYGSSQTLHIASPTNVRSELGLPSLYALHQNYPNPFNPTTTIKYDLPVQAHVLLKIYNVLGQNIGTLIDQVQQAGFKSISFDASKFPSGVYFYRLQAGSFVEVKKMLLMK